MVLSYGSHVPLIWIFSRISVREIMLNDSGYCMFHLASLIIIYAPESFAITIFIIING